MTSYNEIYERFAQKITDFKLLDLSDADLGVQLYAWMLAAIGRFRRCKTDLSQRDDETQQFTEDLLDIEKEILAEMMVVEWLNPQINSVLYTAQFFGTSEENFYAQQTQLSQLQTLKKNSVIRAQKLMRDYGYQNLIWGGEDT